MAAIPVILRKAMLSALKMTDVVEEVKVDAEGRVIHSILRRATHKMTNEEVEERVVEEERETLSVAEFRKEPEVVQASRSEMTVREEDAASSWGTPTVPKQRRH